MSTCTKYHVTGTTKLCLTQGQVEEFCHSHRDLLRQEGYDTFFLFETNGEMFVADVYVDGGELKAYMCRFDRDYVWRADYRPRLVVREHIIFSSLIVGRFYFPNLCATHRAFCLLLAISHIVVGLCF